MQKEKYTGKEEIYGSDLGNTFRVQKNRIIEETEEQDITRSY